jgi:hypothetical protein
MNFVWVSKEISLIEKLLKKLKSGAHPTMDNYEDSILRVLPTIQTQFPRRVKIILLIHSLNCEMSEAKALD